MTNWEQKSDWLVYLGVAEQKAHEKWQKRGRIGDGRLEVEGQDLRGAMARGDLDDARFVRCDLSHLRMGLVHFERIELVDCKIEEAFLQGATFDGARIQSCSFAKSGLQIAKFRGAKVVGGTWCGTYLTRSFWTRATVDDVGFSGADIRSANLIEARFTNCDFRESDLSVEPGFEHLGETTNTIFVGCDFRNANLDGRRLNNTTFDHCLFHGLKGKPILEGPVTLIAPDLSPEGDGSGLVDPDVLLDSWRR